MYRPGDGAKAFYKAFIEMTKAERTNALIEFQDHLKLEEHDEVQISNMCKLWEEIDEFDADEREEILKYTAPLERDGLLFNEYANVIAIHEETCEFESGKFSDGEVTSPLDYTIEIVPIPKSAKKLLLSNELEKMKIGFSELDIHDEIEIVNLFCQMTEQAKSHDIYELICSNMQWVFADYNWEPMVPIVMNIKDDESQLCFVISLKQRVPEEILYPEVLTRGLPASIIEILQEFSENTYYISKTEHQKQRYDVARLFREFIFDLSRNDNIEIRRLATLSLRCCDDKETLGYLVCLVNDKKEDKLVRRRAMKALSTFVNKPSDEQIKLFLDDKDEEIRKFTISMLYGISESTQELIVNTLLRNPTSNVLQAVKRAREYDYELNDDETKRIHEIIDTGLESLKSK